MPAERTALLISYSDIRTDPRLRRQIDWLNGSGWTVDTLGLGDHPTDAVRDHFVVGPLRRWATTRAGTAVIYLALPARLQFRILLGSRIPRALVERIRSGGYSVVVFNEYEFAPWVADGVFDPARTHLHLDLHEYREPEGRSKSRWGRLTARYYKWVRAHIGSPRFHTRSTVARGIASLYEREFGFAPMTLVRNAPPFVEQNPSPVDDSEVRMLFHGLASWSRGLPQIVSALEGLDRRFTMTFMLTQPPQTIERLQDLIDSSGLGDRAKIIPPAPMHEVATRANAYDLEIIFYPPTSTNVELALPNKVFEAIQGRLGLVIGHSPMLEDIVRAYDNGIVVDGWTGDDLRRTLAALSADDIRRMKQASVSAARDLNAEGEGRSFLDALGVP